jgi:cytochrome b561
MFAATFTGWALVGTFRNPLNKDALGLTVPSIFVSQDPAIHELFESSHRILSYLLAALIIVHIGGALRHREAQ